MTQKIISIPAGVERKIVIDGSSNSKTFSQKIILGKRAKLNCTVRVEGVHTFEQNLTIELKGDQSEVVTQVVFSGGKKAHYVFKIQHIHRGIETKSSMVLKGVVRDHATAMCQGNLIMEPGSVGAEGDVKIHGLLLGDSVSIDASPILDIQHERVQAAHSATVESVNEEQLFYLRSKGLAKEEAMRLIVDGFIKNL